MITSKPANDGHLKTGQRRKRSGLSCYTAPEGDPAIGPSCAPKTLLKARSLVVAASHCCFDLLIASFGCWGPPSRPSVSEFIVSLDGGLQQPYRRSGGRSGGGVASRERCQRRSPEGGSPPMRAETTRQDAPGRIAGGRAIPGHPQCRREFNNPPLKCFVVPGLAKRRRRFSFASSAGRTSARDHDAAAGRASR